MGLTDNKMKTIENKTKSMDNKPNTVESKIQKSIKTQTFLKKILERKHGRKIKIGIVYSSFQVEVEVAVAFNMLLAGPRPIKIFGRFFFLK